MTSLLNIHCGLLFLVQRLKYLNYPICVQATFKFKYAVHLWQKSCGWSVFLNCFKYEFTKNKSKYCHIYFFIKNLSRFNIYLIIKWHRNILFKCVVVLHKMQITIYQWFKFLLLWHTDWMACLVFINRSYCLCRREAWFDIVWRPWSSDRLANPITAFVSQLDWRTKYGKVVQMLALKYCNAHSDF